MPFGIISFFHCELKWMPGTGTIFGGSASKVSKTVIPFACMIYALSLFLEKEDYLSSKKTSEGPSRRMGKI